LSALHSDHTPASMLEPAIQLLPAGRFTVEELTAAYNQTRVDYLVPMPMNAARLAAYLDVYDFNLDDSLVAVEGEQILGLGMLGARANRAWITRLGVLPVRRRRGTGEAIMRGLLAAARRARAGRVILEVIKGNVPAYTLFHKLGFVDTRELLVLRRPPAQPALESGRQVTWMDQGDALKTLRALLQSQGSACRLAWTNEPESFENGGDGMGLAVHLENGGRGWMIFRRQKMLLSHFIFHTEAGDPVEVAEALLAHLYQRFPEMDTYIENLAADDVHLPALAKFGFIEAFRRIEMEQVWAV